MRWPGRLTVLREETARLSPLASDKPLASAICELRVTDSAEPGAVPTMEG